MYTLIIVEENENIKCCHSMTKNFAFVEIDYISVSSFKEILDNVKNSNFVKCKILNIEETNTVKNKYNSIKLYEFISPETLFKALFRNKNLSITKDVVQYFITNWQNLYKDNESKMFYVDRIKSLI